MELIDKEDVLKYYRGLLGRYGYDERAVDSRAGAQRMRFQILTEVGNISGRSVLDVGCGFADLFDFLQGRGWSGEYVGYDITPELIEEARRLHSGLTLEVRDILLDGVPRTFDYVVASGVLALKLLHEDHRAYVERMVRKMFEVANEAVAVNFLSTYVDFQKPESFHCDPHWMIDLASSLSRRFALRHDYFPFEFTVYVYKDQTFDRSRPVFHQFLTNFERMESAKR